MRKASAAVGKLLSSDDLRARGIRVIESALYEHEVRAFPVTYFASDNSGSQVNLLGCQYISASRH